MFEPSEIYIGDMLNITKSLQGKETHGLGVLYLIHNIHWLASSRKLRFIHNGSITHRCDYMAYCQKGVLLSNICELHENKENKTYVNNGSIIYDQYKPQAHQIIIIYCNVKACIGHLMFQDDP